MASGPGIATNGLGPRGTRLGRAALVALTLLLGGAGPAVAQAVDAFGPVVGGELGPGFGRLVDPDRTRRTAGESGFRLTPSLTNTLEYSDNVDLEPDDTDSAFITRVTPGLAFTARSARFDSAFRGSLSFRHQTAGDDDGLNVDTDAVGFADAELVREHLFLENEVSVSQQVLDNDQANTESNRETVQTYRVSPVFRTRLGREADLEARYVFDAVLTGDEAQASDQIGHRAQLGVGSSRTDDPLQWSADAAVAKQRRRDSTDVDRSDFGLSNEYALNRTLSVLAIGGYQTFDDGQNVDFQSPTYRGGFRLRGRRTDFAFLYGKIDDRFSPEVRLTYKFSERLRAVASYTERVSTSQERLVDTLADLGRDADDGAFVDDRTGARFDPRSDPFDIDDQTVRIKAGRLDVFGSRGRNSYLVRGYLGREENLDEGGDEEIARLDVGFSRQLNRRTTLGLSGGYERIDFDTNRTDNEYLFDARLGYDLGRRVNLFASYLFRTQDSDVSSAEYTENRLGIGLRLTF